MGKVRSLAVALAILLIATPLACIEVNGDAGYGQWSMWGGDPQHTGYCGMNVTNVEPQVLWDIIPTGSSYFNGSYHHTYTTPIIDLNGTIYVASISGNVSAIDVGGRMIWTTKIDGFPTTPITLLPNGTLMFFAQTTERVNSTCIYYLRSNGSVLCKVPMFDLCPGLPVTDGNGRIFFGTYRQTNQTSYPYGNATLVAMSPNGSLLWSQDCGNEVFQTPAIAPDGRVYFLAGFHLFAFDNNSTPVWDYTLPFRSIYNRSEPVVFDDGSVGLISSGYVFRISHDGTLQYSTDLETTMEDDGYLLYDGLSDTTFAVLGKKILALDPSGKIIWQSTLADRGGFTSFRPVVCGDRMVLLSDYHMVCINTGNGSLVWASPLLTGTGFAYDYSGLAVGNNGTIYMALDYGGGEQNSFHLMALGEVKDNGKGSDGSWMFVIASLIIIASVVMVVILLMMRRRSR